MATSRKTTAKPPAQKTDVVTAPSKSTPTAALSFEKISQRAYEIWLASGRPDGQQEAHWYAAERELRARLSR